MTFTCSNGNPQHNFFLDHGCPANLDRIESLKPGGFAGESVVFVHGYRDGICLYTGSAVQVYRPDLSAARLIGTLPPGDSVLFVEDGAWVSHNGPVRKYDRSLKPVAEEYVVPHGGPWTTSLGVFAKDASLAMALSFCGGPREWEPELQLNSGKVTQTPSGVKLVVTGKVSRPGDVESMVQLGDRLYAAGERSLAIYSLAGALLKEVPFPKGILHLAASKERNVVGGFCLDDGRWIYREFDVDGTELFSYTLSGAAVPGYIVFDPEGSRYLMSEKRLVKIGADGQRIWSQSLKGASAEAPRFLVYRGGCCAFIDGTTLILLGPDGVESNRIPLRARKIASPPYLDANGTFWIGLAKQSEKVMKVSFKP
jgi:hypothetical protein